MQDYDVVIIGAGHNGLVCAAYLLKAGYRVALLEKRSVPGGAATTEAVIPELPDFKFNLCAIDHEFIHLGPVVEELELTKHGLEYLFCDPVVFCPHPDGKYFLAYQSVEKTCQEIAQFSDRDARKYQEFTEYWQRAIGAMIPMFNAPPKSVVDIAGNYDIAKIRDLFSVIGSTDKTLDFIRTMLTSAEDLLNEWFDSEFLKAPLARLAAELGAPPSQKMLGIGAIMMAMRHDPGMARPKGGTGALVQALLNLIKSLGGEVFTDRHVEKILIDDKGRAAGVRVRGGEEYRASKGVISNIDAQRVFQHLVDPIDADAADPNLRERLERRIVNNNETILKVDLAMNQPLRFEHHNHRDEYLIGSVLIADSVKHVEVAHSDPAIGKIPDANPSLYVVQPTMRDPSMAPPGMHTVWIEFFAPYKIDGLEGTGQHGTGWTDELKNQVADRVVDKLAEYAPNVKSATIGRRVESPAELGERLGTVNGNYYHIDMTLDQMVFFRPLPELANYKTPIGGLFLTGAGTHPGGSISGMPGRNCARVFLQTQQPIAQAFKDARESIKSTVSSVFRTQ
ncbi:MAG TPA: NAD(P)/FAD-dependent oxidoreductase [Thermosynechococcaceae cyanobacterium]